MNLVVDIGNTFAKFAVFQNDDLVFKTSFELESFIKELNHVLEKYNSISHCIISSVGKLHDEGSQYLNNKLPVLELNSNTPLPFNNAYQTPKTLGVDRLALVSAAVKNYPKSNVLVIDAGTCITYDMVTANNQYLGGGISPGIDMRYKSLNNLTANLPLLKPTAPENLVGNTTNEAIHSGVMNGVIHEIDGLISDYKQEFEDLTVILTGGNANFLSKQLKSSIFANSNFLLEGLNYILQFNSKE
ncbi:pantothenate kinase [Hanstruepera neustonica]|uniref:Type III pantothenate kinase n=1 Tax=Hanstruepera neustonica TaxID=1445657 RepID=A0A2K1E4R3_9FLAO|nr:type III pantothenate kinase [Hanstruepera neustonica]PNQ75221.1 pantothenate kinase [Hanstruepera neustonica]